MLMFELDESEVWNAAAAAASPELRKPAASTWMSRKLPSSAGKVDHGGHPASLPVNVPDWPKILKDEYRENRRRDREDSGDDLDDEDFDGGGSRIPPHELVARRLARTRIASSVHEGFGRTLKGRDLSRVRNAIWEKIGFQD